MVTGLSRLNAETFGVPSTDIDFPASVLVYSAAAGYVEIIFRLLPIPLFMWLTSNLILRGRGRTPVFWVLAVLTSLIEPLSNVSTRVLPPVPFLFVLMQSFGINMAQAITFRRQGFLAAIIVRVAFYVDLPRRRSAPEVTTRLRIGGRERAPASIDLARPASERAP